MGRLYMTGECHPNEHVAGNAETIRRRSNGWPKRNNQAIRAAALGSYLHTLAIEKNRHLIGRNHGRGLRSEVSKERTFCVPVRVLSSVGEI